MVGHFVVFPALCYSDMSSFTEYRTLMGKEDVDRL